MTLNFKFPFLFILFAIFFRVVGAISSKYAAITIPDVTILFIISNIFYIITLSCLFLNAITWQQVLIYYPLSFAYPFISLVNFIVLIASAVIFHEGISLMNVIGMVLISVGITLLSWNNERIIA